MAQTVLDYNELFFGVKGEPARIKDETITGAADLKAGDVIVPDGAGKFRAAIDTDKEGGATERFSGWRILLEDAAVSGGDVVAKTGKSGGIFEDKLLSSPAGLTLDDAVNDLLQMNSIYVQKGTNAMRVAGEGA